MKPLLTLLLLTATCFAGVRPESRWILPGGGTITAKVWHSSTGSLSIGFLKSTGHYGGPLPATLTPGGTHGEVDSTGAHSVSVDGTQLRVRGGKVQREVVTDGVHTWVDLPRDPEPKPGASEEGGETQP